MVALFSNVGSHVPFFKKEHMHKATPESLVSSKIRSKRILMFLLIGFNAELPVNYLHASCLCEFISNLLENAPTNNDFSHMAPPHQMAMVTCPEWISGKGNFIDCMHGGSISDDVINTYCYIQVGI